MTPPISPPAISSPDAPWLEIIVPARNEQDRLPIGLARLCAKAAALPPGVEILVVDSASTDRTAEIVRDWPRGPVRVRLINCGRPGKGAAVRAGLLASRAPFVGFCDADMAADLSALDVALRHLKSGWQAVIASRSHPASVVEVRHSPVRKAGAAIFRGAAQVISPGPLDTQCGFKFFAGPIARHAAADLTATGFAFDVELIARCRQLGASIIEIPVNWRDIPGSTFSIWRHSLTVFAEMAAIWLALRAPSCVARADGEAEPGSRIATAVPAAALQSAGLGAAGQP